jgi:hypothetical protein
MMGTVQGDTECSPLFGMKTFSKTVADARISIARPCFLAKETPGGGRGRPARPARLKLTVRLREPILSTTCVPRERSSFAHGDGPCNGSNHSITRKPVPLRSHTAASVTAFLLVPKLWLGNGLNRSWSFCILVFPSWSLGTRWKKRATALCRSSEICFSAVGAVLPVIQIPAGRFLQDEPAAGEPGM